MSAPTESEAVSEEVVAKYKKLLSLARSSLESNQASIAAKDKQINQLMSALEEERTLRLKKNPTASKIEDDASATMPRSLLRRLDFESSIWILIEYEGTEDSWKRFSSEQELDDFIQRIPGVPLTKPHRCLTPLESNQMVVILNALK